MRDLYHKGHKGHARFMRDLHLIDEELVSNIYKSL